MTIAASRALRATALVAATAALMVILGTRPAHAAESEPGKGKAKTAKPAKGSKPSAKPAKRIKEAPLTYGAREDVVAFARDMAERRQLETAPLVATLAQARRLPSVIKAIMPPPGNAPKNWAAYRARFVEPTRLRAGLAFWSANEQWLKQAEDRYGVPPEIIVGIVGVETIYGRQMGTFRVLDALATLTFDFPNGRRDRSAFFRSELENYLLMCRTQGIDPQVLRGSYAGAMGMPQFMPASVNAHAVDFDGDGRIDLVSSTADVIGSVAKFLADAGWQRGLATHFAVTPPADAEQRATLLGPDIVPLFTAQEMTDHGAQLVPDALNTESKLALVELQNADNPPTFVAGTTNFYAVTRYNWSSYYALAVIELGSEIKRLRAAQ